MYRFLTSYSLFTILTDNILLPIVFVGVPLPDCVDYTPLEELKTADLEQNEVRQQCTFTVKICFILLVIVH